jgi:hypothetical protein
VLSLQKIFIIKTQGILKIELNAIRRKYIGTIGGTPLVKLNRVTKEIDALILAKR